MKINSTLNKNADDHLQTPEKIKEESSSLIILLFYYFFNYFPFLFA